MSYRVEVTEKAQEDMRKALGWIAQCSLEKATLWHFEFLEKVDSLENSPARCPLSPESKTHRQEMRHLIFGKYRILFTIEDETVYVLHVRHQAQDVLRTDEEE